MRKLMFKLIGSTLFMLVILAGAFSQPQENKIPKGENVKSISGKVTSFCPIGSFIAIGSFFNKTIFAGRSDTIFMRDSAAIDPAKLKKGDKVTIYYKEEHKAKIAVLVEVQNRKR